MIQVIYQVFKPLTTSHYTHVKYLRLHVKRKQSQISETKFIIVIYPVMWSTENEIDRYRAK
jgi:hypothetical protein